MNSENSLTNSKKRDTYLKRIKKFRELLRFHKISHFLIESPIDIFYLTGIKLSLGKVLISDENQYLVVDGRYFDECQEKSPIRVVLLDAQRPYSFLEKENLSSFGFDSSYTSFKTYEALKELIHFTKPHCQLTPLSNPLEKIRWIKDEEEIFILKKSAEISWKGYQHIKKLIKTGISEKELAFEYEFFCKKLGADALAFDPIIAFGSNSAKPHHRSSTTVLKDNDVLLFDLGIKYQDYCSDMTRVILPSKAPNWLKEIHQVTLEAFRAARALCKPGTLIKDLDEAARTVMRQANLEDKFTHSLGHGLGLDVHESPRISKTGLHKDTPLEAGMVITIEPGLYLAGKGGIRYEDTVLITAAGFEDFYPDGD